MLQGFVETMKVELQRSDGSSPLDLSIEAVLPGVHARMAAQQADLLALRESMVGMEENMSLLRTGVATLLERDNVLTSLFSQMAMVMSSSANTYAAMARISSPFPQGQEQQQQQQENKDESVDVTSHPPSSHQPRPKHMSLVTLYQEWYGLGDFDGIPIAGGIESMERKMKSRWRKHFSGAQKKSFSRTKDVIDGINRRVQTSNLTLEAVIDEWDVLYRGEWKCSTYKMSEWLKDNGFLGRKKPRGKSAIV